MYNTLKFNYLYVTKLLIRYHKLLNNVLNFKSTITKANERYTIRSPKYILPSHNHDYIKLTCRYQLPSLLNQYNAENNMDHNSSPNPIKTIITMFLKQFKTLIKFPNLSLYSNVCNIKNVIIVSTETMRI